MTPAIGHYGWGAIVAVVAIVALLLYRRGRRLIGHQRFNERRLIIRVVIFAVLCVLLLVSYAHRMDPMLEYGSSAGGFAGGVIVALIALRFTQMGRDEYGVWYVPNLYLGIGLIALLLARFAYEYFVMFPQIQKQMEAASAQGAAAVHSIAFAPQPILHGILSLVLGYYVAYYLGILVKARREGHLRVAGGGSNGESQ
ncbi:MAG: hypothetical protein WCB49_10585 [Gammaproteobacteria bacterium]